jgi:hypothetical protein
MSSEEYIKKHLGMKPDSKGEYIVTSVLQDQDVVFCLKKMLDNFLIMSVKESLKNENKFSSN